MARLLRFLRALSLTCVALLLVLFLFIQIQQQIFRKRAEHLIADMQSIRLHQSTWADAATLIRSWARWGHSEGLCTAADCEYTITLEDFAARSLSHLPSWVTNHDVSQRILEWILHSYRFLGGRIASLNTAFIVQDGTIWRTYSNLYISVLPHTAPDDDYGYTLIAHAISRERLSGSTGSYRLSPEHPNYVYGRPGGCEICMMVRVTYTPYESPETIRRITAFNLNCLSPLHSYCLTVEDVLPAAEDWHLYDGAMGARPIAFPPSLPEAPPAPQPCHVPIYALGREAKSVLVASVQGSSAQKTTYLLREVDSVRILETLKGSENLLPGTPARVFPYADGSGPPEDLPEHLERGQRYILLLRDDVADILDQQHNQSPIELDLEFCGTLPDTAEVRAELARGFAQNDHLRRDSGHGPDH